MPYSDLGTASGLIDPANSPSTAEDGVVLPILVDPGSKIGRALRERHELAPWRRNNAGDVAAGRALIPDKPRLASDRVNPHNLFHRGLATQARNVLLLFGPAGRHDAHTLPTTLQVITHA